MKLYYSCHYDGRPCDKEKVNVVNGELVEPSNSMVKEKYKDKFDPSLLEEGWDACDGCKRNYSMSVICYGCLKIDYERSK